MMDSELPIRLLQQQTGLPCGAKQRLIVHSTVTFTEAPGDTRPCQRTAALILLQQQAMSCPSAWAQSHSPKPQPSRRWGLCRLHHRLLGMAPRPFLTSALEEDKGFNKHLWCMGVITKVLAVGLHGPLWGKAAPYWAWLEPSSHVDGASGKACLIKGKKTPGDVRNETKECEKQLQQQQGQPRRMGRRYPRHWSAIPLWLVEDSALEQGDTPRSVHVGAEQRCLWLTSAPPANAFHGLEGGRKGGRDKGVRLSLAEGGPPQWV